MGTNKARVGLVLLVAGLLSFAVSCVAPADRGTGKVIDDARLLCGPALLVKSGGKGGTAVGDDAIVTEVRAALSADKRIDGAAIAVASSRGEVVLTGAVDSAGQSKRAESIALSVIGVAGVKNLLKIR